MTKVKKPRFVVLYSSPEVRQTARSWIAYAWGPLIGLATAPLLARALGAENRGALAAVLQPMTVADAVAAAGLPAAMTYFVARGVRPGEALRQARWLYYPLGFLAALVLACWALYLDQTGVLPLYYSLPPWLIVVPLGAYIASRRGVWQGLGRFRPLDFERALSPTFRLALILAAFVVGASTAGPYIAIYVAASLGAALALFTPFKDSRNQAEPVLERRSLTSYSLRSAGGTIAVALNNRLDQAVLPALITLRELGIYSIAVVVAEIPMIFTAVLARNLLSKTSAGGSRRQLQKTIILGLGATSICCVSIVVAAPVVVPVLFGAQFVDAVGPMAILVFGSGLASIGLTVTAILSGKGFPGKSSYAHALGAGVTIALYGWLWRDMTLIRACYLSVVSQGVIAVASVAILLIHRKKTA